jgi:hypothetical protein
MQNSLTPSTCHPRISPLYYSLFSPVELFDSIKFHVPMASKSDNSGIILEGKDGIALNRNVLLRVINLIVNLHLNTDPWSVIAFQQKLRGKLY